MKTKFGALIVLLFGVLVGYFVFGPQAKPFQLGLDLSGGTLLTYQADVSGVAEPEIESAMTTLRDVIERRVNLFGVSEPLVQVERGSALGAGGREWRLIVELPGVTDIDEAVRQIGQTPLLEFKLRTAVPPAFDENGFLSNVGEVYVDTGLTGRFVERAQVQIGQGGGTGLSNEPIVILNFNTQGADLFEKITGENVGKQLAIFLDGAPISEPVIQSVIAGGQATISGSFTPDEARILARDLSFGALPVPVELLGSQTIGAALGDQVFAGGVRAGLWGLALVAFFLLVWYRVPGLLAILSLGMYIVLMLALFKFIPVTLTAAGIAGFVLSIGMAVDANILIFERFKEEMRRGLSPQEAVTEGFARAWLPIRDGNLSSILSAIILFWFGSSLIEGFALVFGVGVLVSMLTAITVSKVFFKAIVPESFGKISTFLFGSGA
jgi:protein-export membrane protein SecD